MLNAVHPHSNQGDGMLHPFYHGEVKEQARLRSTQQHLNAQILKVELVADIQMLGAWYALCCDLQ
jgi:hypothetical protein